MRASGVLNALVIGVALSLPAGLYAVLGSLAPVGARLTLEPEISVFLRPEAARKEAEALGARLRAEARAEAVRFIPREQALEDLARVQGLSEVIEAVGRNPLPDAFVVRARAGTLEALAADLARLPGVAHVQADALWARRLAALQRIGETALWVLAGLLGAGLVAVTFNTIRLQILTQRDEIEVSKLIGATDAFIRRPFLYLGLVQGLVGGAIAMVLVAGALSLLNRQVEVLAASYESGFALLFPRPADAAALALFAGLLGWLGASLSVSRHLREIEPG